MAARLDYRTKRLLHLEQFVDTGKASGLEIGAADFPVVTGAGKHCQYADFRSREQMISLWSLDPATVPEVTFMLTRDRKVREQITNSYQYVILCHIVEHIPNPIGYLEDVAQLLVPGGIAFVALPDKRRTLDAGRQSTSLAHLLDDYYHDSRYPAFEHILEHARGWLTDHFEPGDWRKLYEFACRNYESGQADPHCHVWTDDEFFEQMENVSAAGLLPELEIASKVPNDPEFNEFYILFQRRR